MNKKIVIKLSFLTATLLHANELDTMKLEPITITSATKTKKSIDGVSASVVVIDREKIEEMGAMLLGDILNRSSGIVRQYGTFASAVSKSKSSISLRGMGTSNTLFLIDGKRFAGESDSAYGLDRISASSIERIEIVKGAMSSLYGADAVGGIINIITKKPTESFEGSLGVTYGSNMDGDGDNTEFNFNVGGTNGKLKYRFYGSQINSEPYTQTEQANILFKTTTGKVSPLEHPNPAMANIPDRYDTDVTYREKAEVLNLGTRVEYDFTDFITAGLDLSYMEETRQGVYNSNFHPSGITVNGNTLPAFNAPINSKDENSRRNIGGDIQWIINDEWSWNFKAYHSDYKKRNITTMKHYEDFGFETEADSASNGMNGNAKITSYEAITNYALNDAHLLTFGAEHRSEVRDTTVFTRDSDMSEESIDYEALYVQDEWEVSDTLNVILGGRYDAISHTENKPTFKVGVVKNLQSGMNLRANIAQAYRTPDMREMYINKQTASALMIGAAHAGYDLKPEFTNSYEIAMGGKEDSFDYDVALFLNQIEDRIEQVVGTEANSYTFRNVSEAETKGLDVRLGYTFSNKITTGISWNELRSKNKDTGNSLEFAPERTITASLDLPVNNRLKLGALLTYVAEQEYTTTQDNGSILDQTTEDYSVLDLTASYALGNNKQYKVHGGINNLLDEEVDTVLGSNVGTYAYVGASVNF